MGTIGSLNEEDTNVVAGNFGHGLLLSGENNEMIGNLIGSNATGTLPLGNDLDGVRANGGWFNAAKCALTDDHIVHNGG